MKVNTVQELHTALQKNKDIELTSDIDFTNSSVAWTNIEYNGILNGNGYTIKNFQSNNEINEINHNFITTLKGKVINVTLENIKLRIDTEAGGICGVNKGEIQSITINNGDIRGKGSKAGGIVGRNKGSIMYSTVKNSTIRKSGSEVGGIVGKNEGSLTYCTVKNSIIKGGRSRIGGISGDNWYKTKITNCSVQNSKIKGNKMVGEIVGLNQEFHTLKQSAHIEMKDHTQTKYCGRISDCYVIDCDIEVRDKKVGENKYENIINEGTVEYYKTQNEEKIGGINSKINKDCNIVGCNVINNHIICTDKFGDIAGDDTRLSKIEENTVENSKSNPDSSRQIYYSNNNESNYLT